MVEARPRRVAVIEDDEAVRDSLALLLAAESYMVEFYPTAETFLAQARWPAVDCLVLDLNLPALDGLQLVQHMHTLGFVSPVLLVTGRIDPGTTSRARTVGVWRVIEKPYEAADLLTAIRVALDSQRHRYKP